MIPSNRTILTAEQVFQYCSPQVPSRRQIWSSDGALLARHKRPDHRGPQSEEGAAVAKQWPGSSSRTAPAQMYHSDSRRGSASAAYLNQQSLLH